MLWWLAQNTITAAVLAAVVALLCRLGRLGPAVRHALWLVVLIKLLMPPLIDWPWQLPDVRLFFPPQPVSLLESSSELDPPLVSDGDPETVLALAELLPDRAEVMPSAANPGGPAGTAVVGRLEKLMELPGLLAVALDLWVVGTAAMCLLQLVRITRFRRLLARGQRAPQWLAKQVDMLADRLKVRRLATLVVPGIGSPFVWHVGRAKLLWPASLTQRQPRERRRSVIVHELAHLRRRDHWVGWLQMVGECLWWWNPLFWYVRRQLRFNAELACDAWVVSTLPEDRRAYAEALIEVTQLLSQTAAPLPALGMNSGARHKFERRLTMIMRDRVPCKVSGLGLVAIGCLALAALPGWSQGDALKKAEAKKVDELTIVAGPYDQFVNEVLAFVDGEVTELDVDGKPAPDSDREKKLQEVEQKLQALLKEVQALRAGGGSASKAAAWRLQLAKPSEEQPKTRVRVLNKLDEGTAQPRIQIIERKATAKPETPAAGQVIDPRRMRIATASPAHVQDLGLESIRDGQAMGSLIVLSRATYKLPKGKAEALARFLQEHGKVQILETKVEGESLTVTTTPEAQKAIGQFVGIMQGLTTTTIKLSTGKVLESKPAVLWKEFDVPAKEETFRIFLNEALQKAQPDKPKEDKTKK